MNYTINEKRKDAFPSLFSHLSPLGFTTSITVASHTLKGCLQNGNRMF